MMNKKIIIAHYFNFKIFLYKIQNIKLIKNYILNELKPLKIALSNFPLRTLIGTAGTFETLVDIVIKDFTGMCEISINEKQFELLNEKDKVNVFLYLQELEEKIEKMGKMSIIVKKQFND